MSWSNGKGRGTKYGAAHQAIQKARHAQATPYTPCSCPGKNAGGCKHHIGPCGKPLGPNTRDWHTPHAPNGRDYMPGLWCAPCNRSEAASRGARVTNARRKQRRGFKRPDR